MFSRALTLHPGARRPTPALPQERPHPCSSGAKERGRPHWKHSQFGLSHPGGPAQRKQTQKGPEWRLQFHNWETRNHAADTPAGCFLRCFSCSRCSTHPLWKTPTRAFTSPELSSASGEDPVCLSVSSESNTSHPRTFSGSVVSTSLLETKYEAFIRSYLGVGEVLFGVSKALVKVFQRG